MHELSKFCSLGQYTGKPFEMKGGQIISFTPLWLWGLRAGVRLPCPMPAAEVAETTTSIGITESDVCPALESLSSITYTSNLSQGFTTERFHSLF